MPLKPEQLAANGSEHAHQMAFFQALAMTKDPIFQRAYAIPNGSNMMDAVAGSRMKAEGLKPGVPDIHFPIAKGPYFSLYIELKRPGREKERNGGCSDDQIKWIGWLKEAGHMVHVCYGWEAARDAIFNYCAQQPM